MNKVMAALHEGFGYVFRPVLKFLVLIAFRPKRTFASEKARQEAFKEPMIIISNHVHGMDGAVLQSLMPFSRVYSLTAKDLIERTKLYGWFLSHLRTIPVDRENASLGWLREGRKKLREGFHIYICPEGRCNRARIVLPFKPGFVTLAAAAGVKVVPIYLNGEYNYFFGKRFRFIVGEPVTMTPPPEGLSEEEMTRQANMMRDKILELEMQLNGTVRTGNILTM